MDWNYVWCQTILLFYQEVLGTVGAFSNFRCVTVRGRGLWQELLRGRESIRQGSLQSGQLLKMQQHHYSLTEPATPVSFTASLFISLWIVISSFSSFSSFCYSHLFSFWYVSFTSLFCLYPAFSFPPAHIFLLQNWQGWASLTPLCMSWPTEAFSFLFNIVRQWSATTTVLGQE